MSQKRKRGIKLLRVAVEWIDTSSTNQGWDSVEKYSQAECTQCCSVGYLVCQTPKKVVLASTVGERGDVLGDLIIPRGCVKRIRRLVHRRGKYV